MNAATNRTATTTTFGGRDQQTAAAAVLTGYLGMCPTCATGPVAIDDEYTASVAPARCPTCGQTSVEYGMIAEMDAILATMHGFDALTAAVAESA